MASSLFHCSFLLLILSVPTVTAADRMTRDEGNSLASRLEATHGASDCWEALLELRACTGEVILFFLNGETYLGPACCRAIRVIEDRCWPTMLGALGFTKEEGSILLDYCGAVVVEPPRYAPPPPSAAPGLLA